MKKQIFPIWMVWPNVFLIFMFILSLVRPDDFNPIICCIIYLALSVLLGISWLTSAFMGTTADVFVLAKWNMQLKLSYLPAYLITILHLIVTFITTTQSFGGIHGGFFALYVGILLGAVSLGGVINMIVCAIVAIRIGSGVKYLDSYYSVNTAGYFFAHLIPIADIFSSVRLYQQVKQFQDLSKMV